VLVVLGEEWQILRDVWIGTLLREPFVHAVDYVSAKHHKVQI